MFYTANGLWDRFSAGSKEWIWVQEILGMWLMIKQASVDTAGDDEIFLWERWWVIIKPQHRLILWLYFFRDYF